VRATPVVPAVALLSACFVLAAPCPASAQGAVSGLSAADTVAPMSQPWTRVTSPAFVVKGDLGEKRLRDVALRLEQFREVLNGQVPQAAKALAAPVTVVAFTHSRDYQKFDRKAFEALGADRGGSDGPLLAVCVEQRPRSDAADLSLYYEYFRLAASKIVPKLPLWLEAGLTDYFATFRISEDGKTAQIGLPIDPYRRANLLSGRPIPLAELVAVDRGRVTLTAADKMTGRFTAQCWALVHYLQLGSPFRAAQAKAFMARVAAGEDGAAAFNASFPDAAKLEQEVLDYVHKPAISYQEISFTDSLGRGQAYTAARMTEAEVAAIRGALAAPASKSK
jgi:hypothetical protein